MANVLDNFAGLLGRPRRAPAARQGFYESASARRARPCPSRPRPPARPPTVTRTPTRTQAVAVSGTPTNTPVGTATNTPAATATATPGAGNPPVQGAITTGDPTQAGRFVRDLVRRELRHRQDSARQRRYARASL